MPRGDRRRDIATQVSERTAAVIVEPVQGLAGAVDLGAPFLHALRQRCDAVGALLIFDEVQCGVGRTGAPFAANLYGVTPDMLTTAKALGNGFPCAALLMSAPLAAATLRPESLGTTFGGGPLACAAIEAVIEAIESEHLLEQVRRIGAYIRAQLHRGSGHRASGRGPARGPAHPPRRRRKCRRSCSSAGSSPAPRAMRTSCACCRPTSCRRSTSTCCAMPWRSCRREALPRPERLHARGGAVAARARAAPGAHARAARAGRQDPRAAVLQSLAAHARLLPGGDGAPGRQLLRHQPRARAAGSSRRAAAW